jgi:hypothetical protein
MEKKEIIRKLRKLSKDKNNFLNYLDNGYYRISFCVDRGKIFKELEHYVGIYYLKNKEVTDLNDKELNEFLNKYCK